MTDDNRPKILIVEDDARQRIMLKILMEQAGYMVVGAADSEEAILYADLFAPDLVLLDIYMANPMNGWDILKRLKTNEKTAASAVIMMSAAEDPADEERARAAGADAFLLKPMALDVLLPTVRKILAAREDATV